MIMGNAGKNFRYIFLCGDLPGPSPEFDLRFSGLVVDRFNFRPACSHPKAGSERFEHRLLHGEPGGEMGRGKFSPEAVGLLCRGKDPVQKAVPPPFRHLMDPGNFNQVNPNSDDGHLQSIRLL